MKAHFSIAIDTEWNRHIALPFRMVKLPDWKKCATLNPSVEVLISDVEKVVEAYKENNIKRVNDLLSKYY